MPELAVKIKMTARSSRTTISGMSHHFFSLRENLKNSLNIDHMDCAAQGLLCGRECKSVFAAIVVEKVISFTLPLVQAGLDRKDCHECAGQLVNKKTACNSIADLASYAGTGFFAIRPFMTSSSITFPLKRSTPPPSKSIQSD
jgi:hypothetical protein